MYAGHFRTALSNRPINRALTSEIKMGQAGRKTPGHTADTTDATIESIKILFQKETDNRIGLTTTFRQMIE